MNIINILRIIYCRLYSFINPIGYCKYLGATIGEKCVLKANMLGSEPWLITIGDHVLLAEGVKILTHDGAGFCLNYGNKEPLRMDMWGTVKIGNNVYVGINAIIMPNVEITNNVIIGAGAIVTKSITEDGVYVGIPARRIKSFDEWKENVMNKCKNTYGMSSKERKEYYNQFFNKNNNI